MSATTSTNNKALSPSVLKERFALRPELLKVSQKLTAYRDRFVNLIEKYDILKQYDFNATHTLDRALDRNLLIKTYVRLLTKLTREPTLHELTDKFSKICRKEYSPWTIRRCILEINRARPRSMPELTLTKETKSQIYIRDTAHCYLKFAEQGVEPSYRDMRLSLKKLRKDSNPSWYSVKKSMRALRDSGFNIHLKHGELTFELVRDTYLHLKKKHGVAPSNTLIAVTLYKKYGIETNSKAVGKMLEKIRKTLGNKDGETWNASRSRKSYDFELINSYNFVKKGLNDRGIFRNPSSSEVHLHLVSCKSQKAPSQSTVTEYFNKLNKERKEKGKKTYPLTRIVFPHHDLIEQAVFSLTKSQNRPPTKKEVVKYIKTVLQYKYSEDLIGRAIRSMNRTRTAEHKVVFSVKPRSNLFDYDIIRINQALSGPDGKRVPKKILYDAIVAENPGKHISWDGFGYRLTSLNRKGIGIKIKGSPNQPMKKPRKLSPEELEAIKREARESLARKITETLINKKYPGRAPAHINQLKTFFETCAIIALESHNDKPAYGVQEVKGLLDLHGTRLRLNAKQEVED